MDGKRHNCIPLKDKKEEISNGKHVLMLEDKEFLKQELKETERAIVTKLQINESFSISPLSEFQVK